jgi:prevent-host-death family protein
MRQVDMREAKAHLSRLVDAAAGGERIILARAGRPVALLCPLPFTAPRRRGALAGRIKWSADFDSPLPETIREAFEGKE